MPPTNADMSNLALLKSPGRTAAETLRLWRTTATLDARDWIESGRPLTGPLMGCLRTSLRAVARYEALFNIPGAFRFRVTVGILTP